MTSDPPHVRRADAGERRAVERLVAVHRDAMDEVRGHKPGVPQIGEYGIALRDELELELMLS